MKRGKIPVFRSVGAGLRFFFGDFWRILRVAWFPGLLIVLAAATARYMTAIPALAGMSDGQVVSFLQGWGSVLSVLGLFEMLMMLVVLVGLYRLFLDDFRPRGFAYFRLSGDEWRVAGLSILIIEITVIAFLCIAIAGIAGAVGFVFLTSDNWAWVVNLRETSASFGLVAAWVGQHGPSLFLFYILFGIALTIWINLRFAFAVPASIEHYAGTLGNAWKFTKHNALRLLGFGIVLSFVLLVLLLTLFFLLIMGATLAVVILQVLLTSPDGQEISQQSSDLFTKNMEVVPAHIHFAILSIQEAFSFVLNLSATAIAVGATAYAFRAVWPRPGQEGR